MVGRLLWKELREGWLVVLVAAIAPWVLFQIASTVPYSQRDYYIFAGAICSPIAIALWASTKGGRKKYEGKLPLAHLPVNPIIEKIITVVIPFAISILAGAWLGALCIEFGKPVIRGQDPIDFGALYMAVAFAGCYVIASAISTWAGITAGVVWAITGITWVDEIYRRAPIDKDLMSITIRIALSLIVCFALLILFSYLKRPRIAQWSSIALLIAVMLGPPIYDSLYSAHSKMTISYFDPIYSSDRSILMRRSSIDENKGKTAICYENRVSGFSTLHIFDGLARPVAFSDDETSYVAQQIPKSGQVRIIEWNGKKLKEIARVPAPEDATNIAYFYSTSDIRWFGSVSSDSHYLMVNLNTYGGQGIDVWIVNLRNGDSWIAFPNINGLPRHVSWFADKLVLSGSNNIMTVDLKTKKTSITQPDYNEVKR